jgi:hypothetical protein
MRKTRLYALLVMLAVVAPPVSALQLHWSTGSTEITFTSATRCTLVVQADSTESSLPSEWRLLWVADSSSLQLVAVDSTVACLAGTAQGTRIDPPTTAADSAANFVTERFCSAGDATRAAEYVLDLPAGGRGKFKAAALDSNDPNSESVLETNEATYNGGILGAYPPAILRAGRTHPSTQLCVKAVGVGLATSSNIAIAAPDTSWHLALTPTAQSDRALTAVAQVAADLPPFVLRIDGHAGTMGVATLDADTLSPLSVQPACVDFMKEINLISHENIQPKDFAIVASRDSFHIFYIRHDMNLSTDATEKIIGHKRSSNLNDWFPTENTMTAIQARPGRWDNFHVWAPTIIRKPNDITYYMLYTGVQDTVVNSQELQIQRIGVATSTDLNIWAQDATWIWEPKNTSWAEPDSTTTPGQQFRDPFVMADPNPDFAGHYLMFLVGGSKTRHPRMVVGVARTSGPVADFRRWNDVGPLLNTDAVHSGASQVESPHAFKDPGGLWSLYYTGYNFGAPNDSAFVTLQSDNVTLSSPIDADTTHWSAPDTLYRSLGGDQTLQFWHGSEYLNWAPGYEYLGAYDDNQHAVDISEISWRSSHTYVLNDSCPPAVALGVDPKAGHLEFALNLLGARPSRIPVAFAVETPAKAHVRLSVYDVLGRRVRTLLDEELQPGRRELRWDGRGATGEAVGPGIYFARLTSAAGQRVARVVLLR